MDNYRVMHSNLERKTVGKGGRKTKNGNGMVTEW
jgi:hypothetical protein